MKRLAIWLSLLVLSMAAVAAMAQPMGERPARQPFSQAELDQMLAPIALYPDSLLSQILMAATYPRDVAEAASWSRSQAGLRGDDAVRAAQNEPWDPSVISLTAFPQVLAMMGQRRYWTERLGEAYIEQPEQVMDTIQQLRRRADGAGTLRSSDEIIVQRQGDDYILEPPMPEVVHVPYYDPRVAYGSWWWPDYQPVYWAPWPGYRYYPGYGGIGWGYGITIGSGFFFGALDWRHRYVRYSHHRPWYFRHHSHWRGGHRWAHDRDHWRRSGDHWRGRDGDRTRDGNRDGRWRDGDRTRDGTRDGRWRDRDRGDRADPRQPQRAPAPTAERGTTPNAIAAPRYRYDAVPGEAVQQPQRAAREQPANGMVRPAEARTFGAPRGAYVAPAPSGSIQQRAAPAPQQAPAQAPAPAPQPRNAQSREPVERPAAESPAPAAQPERSERQAPANRRFPRSER